MNDEISQAVDLVWDYMRGNDGDTAADCLVVLGSLRDDVASYAAQLESRYSYEHVVISGGNAHVERTEQLGWGRATEAEHFWAVMKEAGCTRTDILLETSARNTGENASLTAKLLADHRITPRSVLIVTKPYMVRRAQATFDVQWPQPQPRLNVTSVPVGFKDYCVTDTEREQTIHTMVGDLQRIMEYPKRGFQPPQVVPKSVLAAYRRLKMFGYTDHLIT